MRKRAPVPTVAPVPSADPASIVPPAPDATGTPAPEGTAPVEFPPATPATPEQADKIADALKLLGVTLPAAPVNSIEEATRLASEYFLAMAGAFVPSSTPEPERPRTGADVLALLGPELAIGLAGLAVAKAIENFKGDSDGSGQLLIHAHRVWIEAESMRFVDIVANVTATLYNRSRGLA